MSSFICSDRHFNCMEVSLIGLTDHDGLYILRAWNVVKVRDFVTTLFNLNHECVCAQSGDNREVFERRPTPVKVITRYELLKAINCLRYQCEIEGLEKFRELTEEESTAWRFADQPNSLKQILIVPHQEINGVILSLISMNFEETDIDFDRIDWRRFEELCFDLLMKYQFHDMIWHQGSADGGKDIEALATVVNPLLGAYTEKWFFECKFYTGGIPMTELVSKIGWATAHRVKHFVLMTNTHPTKDTRDYLNKTQEKVDFKIHVIDGKMIKHKLLAFPDLIIKYFADDTVAWVKSLVRQWLFQHTLPEIKTLARLASTVDPGKLSKEELVFLMMAYQQSDYDEDWLPDEIEPFDFDFLWPTICFYKNEIHPIDLNNVFFSGSNNWFHLSAMSSTIEKLDQFAFAMQHDSPDLGNIQITLKCVYKQFNVKIACKPNHSNI